MCTYFPNGSLASLTDTSGKPVYYEYDWRGKLSGVKDENGNTLAQYTHTPGGKLKGIRHGNGMHTWYEYDTDGNIIHLRLERPDGTALTDWQYEYDLNGNRTLKAGSYADVGDKLCGTVIRYQYDKMDRLTEESHDGEAVGYSYDPCGNRLEKVDKNGKEVYTYNVKNQLVSRKSEKAEMYYRYDLQGNVLEATGTEGGMYYSYNAFNQQTKVRKSDGSCLESQYDAEYLRAGTVENGQVSGFVYYNGELLAELDQNQETAGRYMLGYGVAAGWNHQNEDYHFYHLDEQNSTAYITGTGNKTENRYQYDAFGVVRDRHESFPNRILYTGQQYDTITEQYYLRARYYNPAVGRFLQEDVYRGDGLNLYAYCANNPVIYYDPSGFGTEYNPKEYIDPSALPGLSATQKKNTPGIVTGLFTSSVHEMGDTIRSSDFTTIAIPQEVAQKLVGKQFNSFDELRGEIYNCIAGTQYAREFCPGNQTLMSQGKAPVAPQGLQTGDNYNQIKYNIHHIKPVEDGGDVYNLDNFIIAAPKTHDEIHAEIDAQKKEQKTEQTCDKK